MNLNHSLYATVLGAVLALPSAAYAEGEMAGHGNMFPVEFANRPMVMPKGMLGIMGELPIAHYSIEILGVSKSDTSLGLMVGAAYGLIDKLEVGATVLPLMLSPDFEYENPSVYGRYLFLEQENVEIGALAGLRVGVAEGSHSALTLGVPVALHFAHALRVDTGLVFGVAFGDETEVAPVIPIEVWYQAAGPLAIGLLSGIEVPKVNFDNATLPFFVGALYALPAGSMPMLDLGLRFGFPGLVQPGGHGTDLWQLSFFATYYLNL